MNKSEIGSATAKGGFANERAVCEKFDNWKKDKEAQIWLKIMGHRIEKIDSVKAIQIPTRIKRSDIEKFGMSEEDYEDLMRFKKADAQIKIIITIGNILKVENLSLKKANSDADYNQVDKRRVDSYQEMWGFDEDIALGLKLFTGELNPESHPELVGGRELRDKRRMFLDELPENIRNKITNFFTEKEKNEMMKTGFKGCDCPIESWEIIIVDRDEQFEDRSTVYYHCDECGEDYAILDYYTGKILYRNPKLKETKRDFYGEILV